MKDPKTNEWLEPSEGIDMSSDKGRLFKKDPAINVISKEDFEDRVEKVFHLLWKSLSKSFGPYGAPTLIYNYPWSHATKDGFTIMKNLSFDASETKLDEAISNMAGDICGRLNYSVGDGTTSAIIATNSIYQNYRELKNELTDKFILPRDVIHMYEEIKDEIIKRLQPKIKQIRTEDLDQLRQNIYDVVYISSNGDELITNYIADLYKELGAPGVTCRLSPDGITRKILVNGYKYELTLNDRLYINSDDNTMYLKDADVVIFGTKITKTNYKEILVPLNNESRKRGRHLIVAAPTYDEVALQQVISVDLNREYSKFHDVNMVLTTYRAISAHTRRLVNDFSVLMNTTVIDRAMENSILDDLAKGYNIASIFNIDNRDIDGLKCIAYSSNEENKTGAISFNKGEDELPEDYKLINDFAPLVENSIDLGYVKECSLGLKTSQFTDLCYNKNRYEAILKEAKDILDETEKKYQKLGTFNIEVSQAQDRLYALNLKMGVIEVGADSELSQKMIKDSVDDAIRAASSAFNHGVVLGCNINLIQVIRDMYNEAEDGSVYKTLIDILLEGFLDVARTVISNAFKDVEYEASDIPISEIKSNIKDYINKIRSTKGIIEDTFDEAVLDKVIDELISKYGTASIHNVLIYYALTTNEVFDVSTFLYSDKVINSSQTDEEILKATIDLITLLITGNQMVVTQKHNF